ncbi:MAG: hypothetical protein BWY76_00183 [bacterium ADurb.Bin429]|nr:MAG: hypothetical protein BWY76_00183 [bacterium ADurb.Bin429]
MSWIETFTHFSMYLLALLPAGILFAILKTVVPLSDEARAMMRVGTEMAMARDDARWARAGIVLAGQMWAARKRGLFAISLAAGLLISSLAYMIAPVLTGLPIFWVIALPIVGVLCMKFSKY